MIRSMLFLPGNSPNMLMNGDVFGADAVILDLEDAVSPDEKDAARILVRNAMKMGFGTCRVAVRINGLDGPLWKADLEALVPLSPHLIIPPKIGLPEDVRTLCAFLDKLEADHGLEAGSVGIIPLIETALGLEHAYHIATASPRIRALFLGAEDLTADMGAARTKEGTEIFYARTRMVAAARAAGVEVFDTPFTDVNDDEGAQADAALAKSLGFTGKVAVSPRHIPVINGVFSPTQAEIRYAGEVLAAMEAAAAQGKGAVSLYGKMIDPPIVARARQVLDAAAAIQGRCSL